MSRPWRDLCYQQMCQRSQNVDVLSKKIGEVSYQECRSGRKRRTKFSHIFDQEPLFIEPQLLILADAQINAAGDSFLGWDDLIGQR